MVYLFSKVRDAMSLPDPSMDVAWEKEAAAAVVTPSLNVLYLQWSPEL